MRWSREFTALLLQFAGTVAEVGGLCWDESLRLWTPLYLNFTGLDRSFDPAAPTWREFVSGLQGSDDPIAWSHSFYLEHSYDYPAPEDSCFSWSYEEATRTVRFHFYGSQDTSGHSPISKVRREVRLRELTVLFAEVKRTVPEAEAVRGRSWLYNLPQYCRLFPPEYIDTAVAIEPELQFMSLWGQFLNRQWNLRHEAAQRLLENIAAADSLEALRGSFPLSVRAPRCSIEHFYRHYSL